jgi:hypothetical protein
MPTIINQNWLNSHASRKYPLDDAATGIDDTGLLLPDDIILDLHIAWPATYGDFAFIGGITITESLVSVIIMAASAVDSAAAFTPLGAVTIRKPATGGLQQPIAAMVPGVGGFVLFGDTAEHTALRFSTVSQSRLTSKTARPYAALPVQTIGRYSRRDTLSGIVKLVAGPGLQISAETVLLNGEPTAAIMLQLQENTTNTAFQQYIGACGSRPESNSCDAPGIQTIGGVAPDCDGNLNIVFQQLVVGNMPECTSLAAGFVIDQGIGLAAVCAPRTKIGRFVGVDQCAESSSIAVVSSASASDSSSSDSSESADSVSSVFVICPDLPFTECFADGMHEDWRTLAGTAALTSRENPYTALECCDEAGVICDTGGLLLSRLTNKNLVIWDSCAYSTTINKSITTAVQLIKATMTTPANGGILLNAANTGSAVYWIVGLDAADNAAKLWRYNGTSLITEHTTAITTELLQYDAWYTLAVTTTDLGGGLTAISLTVTKNSDTVPLVSFTVSTSRYGVADGKVGVATNRAAAVFDYWSIADNA